jgi:hypothetical protein
MELPNMEQVTKHKEMFDPGDETLRPPGKTDEEKERIRKEVEEQNRRLTERIEKE